MPSHARACTAVTNTGRGPALVHRMRPSLSTTPQVPGQSAHRMKGVPASCLRCLSRAISGFLFCFFSTSTTSERSWFLVVCAHPLWLLPQLDTSKHYSPILALNQGVYKSAGGYRRGHIFLAFHNAPPCRSLYVFQNRTADIFSRVQPSTCPAKPSRR